MPNRLARRQRQRKKYRKKDGIQDFIQRCRAKRAEMKTVHGTIQTPVFMNVGTVAAIRGRGFDR